MVTEAKINEIFSSIQGEGPVIGYQQLFIRFCGCNLKCEFCDTEFDCGVNYTPAKLYEYISANFDLLSYHSISLTGGEPLLYADFLKEFFPMIKSETKIYLETNATLPQQLLKVKDYIDIISADIKLPSSAGKDTFELHDEFLSECSGVKTFAKIVFDENITQSEIEKCCETGNKYNIELVLQPKMIGQNMAVSSEFCTDILDKFLKKYHNVRLIPQVHKFLDVR